MSTISIVQSIKVSNYNFSNHLLIESPDLEKLTDSLSSVSKVSAITSTSFITFCRAFDPVDSAFYDITNENDNTIATCYSLHT